MRAASSVRTIACPFTASCADFKAARPFRHWARPVASPDHCSC
jgi:hypothetical protein